MNFHSWVDYMASGRVITTTVMATRQMNDLSEDSYRV